MRLLLLQQELVYVRLRPNRLAHFLFPQSDAVHGPHNQAIGKQCNENSTISQGTAQVGLYKPYEVNHASSGAEVDQSMQHLPPLAAQAADPASRGSKRKR